MAGGIGALVRIKGLLAMGKVGPRIKLDYDKESWFDSTLSYLNWVVLKINHLLMLMCHNELLCFTPLCHKSDLKFSG